MDNIKLKQKEWLVGILAHTGLKPSQLAQKAGLSTTTVTRFLNAEEHKTALSQQTMSALQNALLALAPNMPEVVAEAFATADETPAEPGLHSKNDIVSYPLEQIPFEKEDYIRSLLDVATNTHAGRSLWVVKNTSLQGRGYMPGDIIGVDEHAEPRNGDAVCAQLYDLAHMETRVLLRYYSPPYLLANDVSCMHQPLAVKDQHLKLLGVVLFSCRPRRLWG